MSQNQMSQTFQTWGHKSKKYLAVPNADGWHVVDNEGGNFGAWQSVESFRALQAKGNPNGSLPMPDTTAIPSIRIQYTTKRG